MYFYTYKARKPPVIIITHRRFDIYVFTLYLLSVYVSDLIQAF